MALITNFKLLKEYGISILKSGGGRWTAASGTLQVTNHSGGVAVSAETPEAALAQCLAISYPELTEQTEGFIESMPDDIDKETGEVIHTTGKDDLSLWFSLSYASWLTLPRVLLEDMPDQWQKDLALLLNQYDDTYSNRPEQGTRVQVTEGGKLVKTPKALLNYRRPDEGYIASLRGRRHRD